MTHARPQKTARILFDEYHSESWSVSEEKARAMQPDDPAGSSYQVAARALAERDFEVLRNLNQPLNATVLASTHVLALLHPCDPKWESTTTSVHPPRFSAQEIRDIREFVRKGGSLLVLTEYEHDKYGDNLNELIEPFGIRIENTTVNDRTACTHENPTWFFAQPAEPESPLAHLAHKVCFYRAGSCTVSGEARIAWQASESAHPSHAGLVAIAQHGKGRVLVATDSSLFGDARIREFDHLQLWLNMLHWCAAPAFHQPTVATSPSAAGQSPAWLSLKSAVNELRLVQNPNGSVESPRHSEAKARLETILGNLEQLKTFFPHQSDYFQQLPRDFHAWMNGGFQKPDFGKSLAAFNPELDRRDGIENLSLFPMYTPNASKDIRFEAILLRVPWPDWLAELEKTYYRNDKFVPGHLVDFTEGYRSDCAVLFPETVSLLERPTNNFAIIFCDREARRLQSYAQKASAIVHLDLHPQLECFLASLPLMQDTLGLWDLIHDKSHSVGELPFDPFMIRQKAPFWMYALEELRVDLRSFSEATRLAKEGFPFAHYVTYAILFDRIFRFPIMGARVRNYDALGGQLLFSFLHQHDVLLWSDNKLCIRWDLLPGAVSDLREKIATLYKMGADCSKMTLWLAAHDLISTSVKPNVASKWRKDSREITDECDPKHWLELIHPDEFPLGHFHTHLLARMSA